MSRVNAWVTIGIAALMCSLAGGGIFLVSIAGADAASAARVFYPMAAAFTIVGLVLAVIGWRSLRAIARRRHLLRVGLKGTACATSFSETGVVLDGLRRLVLDVRIEVPGHPPFEARVSDWVPVSGVARVSTGRPIPVYVNPEQPSDFVLDWGIVH